MKNIFYLEKVNELKKRRTYVNRSIFDDKRVCNSIAKLLKKAVKRAANKYKAIDN